ncbi:hypothetical protein [Marinobacter lipolyticus]|uniref:hypothetical protein n=1 Tax=Marinobacter lipolyticus TaxID=209639 RepID=UPI003A920A87
MEVIAIVVALILVGLAGVVWGGKPPKAYAVRRCMGREWKAAFPETRKAEIRDFLLLFVQTFAFKDQYKLRFEPDDRILDVYNATSNQWGIDSMELETLSDALKKHYEVDLHLVWHENLTLGELFSRVQQCANERTG